jgi:nitrogen regulatory protein P-II 1
MKLIIAIVRPEKLAAVQAALNKRDVHVMTASEVLDCCQEQRSAEIYRGRELRRPVSKLRLEIAVEDYSLRDAVEAIERVGEGKVFVMGLDDGGRRYSFTRNTFEHVCKAD